jgi:hypothetical protein
MVSKIYVLRATSFGKKSLVPFGIAGFCAIHSLFDNKVNKINGRNS